VTDVAVDSPDVEFSLVDDPPLRLQRALRIAPRTGYGAGRRAALLVLVTWAPVIVWAAARGLLGPELWGEHAIRHLGFHARCLLAIPLLVLSGPLAARVLAAMVANFVHSGLVGQEQRAAFTQALRSVERLRDNALDLDRHRGRHRGHRRGRRTSGAERGSRRVRWTTAGTGDFGALWSVYVSRPGRRVPRRRLAVAVVHDLAAAPPHLATRPATRAVPSGRRRLGWASWSTCPAASAW
jgi:hypothetical protein